MFTSKDGRKINKGDLVGVHWNSHKKTYSIVKMKSRNTIGLVLGYANNVTLSKCTTKIDKSKQEKVRRKKVKDRHAFIVGEFVDVNVSPYKNTLYYNPYELDDFVDYESYAEERFARNKEIEYMKNMKNVCLTIKDNKPFVYWS